MVLILQAVAMEIMVISQFQCCRHCRKQWERWLARDRYSEDVGYSSEELLLNLFFWEGFCPLSIIVSFQCVSFVVCFFFSLPPPPVLLKFDA